MAKGKVVWLGNGVATFLNTPDSEPVRVGEELTLTQGQVTALEGAGHRFAKPGTDEAEDAQHQAEEEAQRQAATAEQTSTPETTGTPAKGATPKK